MISSREALQEIRKIATIRPEQAAQTAAAGGPSDLKPVTTMRNSPIPAINQSWQAMRGETPPDDGSREALEKSQQEMQQAQQQMQAQQAQQQMQAQQAQQAVKLENQSLKQQLQAEKQRNNMPLSPALSVAMGRVRKRTSGMGKRAGVIRPAAVKPNALVFDLSQKPDIAKNIHSQEGQEYLRNIHQQYGGGAKGIVFTGAPKSTTQAARKFMGGESARALREGNIRGLEGVDQKLWGRMTQGGIKDHGGDWDTYVATGHNPAYESNALTRGVGLFGKAFLPAARNFQAMSDEWDKGKHVSAVGRGLYATTIGGLTTVRPDLMSLAHMFSPEWKTETATGKVNADSRVLDQLREKNKRQAAKRRLDSSDGMYGRIPSMPGGAVPQGIHNAWGYAQGQARYTPYMQDPNYGDGLGALLIPLLVKYLQGRGAAPYQAYQG
jgi:type II secretory pathway pseudopilin PulG